MHFADSANLHPSNRREFDEIRGRYYFPPMLRLYKDAMAKHGLPDAAHHLTDIMREAQSEVEELIQQRKAAGRIRDADQARKNLAGNGFQALAFCALASLQAGGLIPSHVVFTLKAKNHPRLGGSFIQVGPETIKPDVDLLAHSDRDGDAPVCIYSLKTSLRERAGQTHRWKLLLDIVTADNCRSIKEKYDLQYGGDANFRLGLVTTNFYDEITAPQQRGLFKFFDHVYLTKPGDFQPPVSRFSAVAADLRGVYA